MLGFGKKAKSADEQHPKSSQSFLDVAEVRDGVVILKDGGLRSILAVASVNFSLKAEDEQNAIIASYQSFLNSLDFPIQICMQSRRMDVSPYLDLMRDRMHSTTNQLMQMQISEYIDFISKLVETAHIMTKGFFVVVPYGVERIGHSIASRFSKIINPGQSVALDAKSFDEHKTKLADRTSYIQGQLGSMGLHAIQLNTNEIIELLYSSYNIGAASTLHADALNKLEVSDDSTI